MQFHIDVKINGEPHDVSDPFDKPDVEEPVYVWTCNKEGGCGCGCSDGTVKIEVDTEPSGSIDPGQPTGPRPIDPPQTRPVTTLKEWGPSYLIEFKVRISQFSGQVIYFGTAGGKGVPSVVSSRDGKLEITSIIHGKEVSASTEKLKRNIEYTITISQKPSSKNSRVVITYFCFLSFHQYVYLVSTGSQGQ